MGILILLAGVALALGLAAALARRLDLPVGDQAPGSAGRKMALILLAVLTAGLGVCGGAGTLVGVIDQMQPRHRGDLDLGPLFLTAGVAGLLAAGLGLGLLWRLRGRPRNPPVPGSGDPP